MTLVFMVTYFTMTLAFKLKWRFPIALKRIVLLKSTCKLQSWAVIVRDFLAIVIIKIPIGSISMMKYEGI